MSGYLLRFLLRKLIKIQKWQFKVYRTLWDTMCEQASMHAFVWSELPFVCVCACLRTNVLVRTWHFYVFPDTCKYPSCLDITNWYCVDTANLRVVNRRHWFKISEMIKTIDTKWKPSLIPITVWSLIKPNKSPYISSISSLPTLMMSMQ